MKLDKMAAIFLILTFVLVADCFAAEEGIFPKIGFVKNDGANVRAGDSANFESLCKLEKGDPVKIVDKRYGWYEIVLPRKAHMYIKNDFVDLDSKMRMGVVNALRVNLRARPGTKYSILGQVSKPEQVTVVAEKDGWYEIESPEATSGWIHSSQISFTLEDIKD